MWGETEKGKTEGGDKQCAASAALAAFPPERKVSGILASLPSSGYDSVFNPGSCFTGRLLYFLLASFSPLFLIFLFSVLEVPSAFCFSLYVPLSLSLCFFGPPSPPHTYIIPDHQERCSCEHSAHIFLETQHQPWSGGTSFRAQGIPTTHTDLCPTETSNLIGFADIRWLIIPYN